MISPREPNRSESLPAIGATRMIRIVIGRNAAPGLHRRVAEHVLHVERDEEEHAEHRERDEQDDEVRAHVRAVAEERQVEHRRALVALEQDEGGERHGRDDERADDPRGSPAVRVRLDQAVGQREEPDRGRHEAREVEPLMGRVARLVDQEEARGDAQDPDRAR